MPVGLYVCVSLCLTVYLTDWLFVVCLTVCLSGYLPACLSRTPSLSATVSSPVCLSISVSKPNLFVWLYVYTSVWLSVGLSLNLNVAIRMTVCLRLCFHLSTCLSVSFIAQLCLHCFCLSGCLLKYPLINLPLDPAQSLSIYDHSSLLYIVRSFANQMPNATPVSGSTLSLSPSHRSLTLSTSSLSSGSTLKLLWGSALAGLELCHIVLQRIRFNCRPFQAFQANGAAPRRGDCFPFPWHFQLAANSLLSAHNHILHVHIYGIYILYIYGIYTCSYVPDNCGAACP